ncbi:hypothetical protein TruAng_011382 [Truncatella angustata]|nr:hypothetical protein TruAng_011382 [Truncatella angustata]
MDDTNEDVMKIQARFAKGRTWANHPGKSSHVRTMLPVLNSWKLEKINQALEHLNTEKEEIRKSLDDNEDWIASTNDVMSELQRSVKYHRERHGVLSQRLDSIKSECKNDEHKLNALSNNSAAFQSRIETKYASLHNRLVGLENGNQQSIGIAHEHAETLALLVEYKVELKKLLQLINSEEKLEFLRKAFEEPHVVATPSILNPPPVSPLTNYGEEMAEANVQPLRARFCSRGNYETRDATTMVDQNTAGVVKPDLPAVPVVEASQTPASLTKFLKNWSYFNEVYSDRTPKREDQFIISFLVSFRPRVASMLQRTLMRFHTLTRRKLHAPRGRFHVRLFVDPTSFTWHDLDAALDHLDLDALTKIWDDEEHKRRMQKMKWNHRHKQGDFATDELSPDPNTSQLHNQRYDEQHSQWIGRGDPEL